MFFRVIQFLTFSILLNTVFPLPPVAAQSPGTRMNPYGSPVPKFKLIIRNLSSSRVFLYGMGGRSPFGHINPGKTKTLTMPGVAYHDGKYYYTNQIMAFTGGVWTTSRSGWTSMTNLGSCATRYFKNYKGSTFTWEITGTAMKCKGPMGYWQPGRNPY